MHLLFIYIHFVSRMDLLEPVLRTANAQNFTEKFKEHGIDAAVLSLLTDDDLQLLGIEDSNIRQNILNRIANLHIRKEYVCIKKMESSDASFICLFSFAFYRKRNNLIVDEDYVLTAIHCINQQLLLHYASLSYAITKKDIVLCDVKLSRATQCLAGCVDNLQAKVNVLKQMVI